MTLQNKGKKRWSQPGRSHGKNGSKDMVKTYGQKTWSKTYGQKHMIEKHGQKMVKKRPFGRPLAPRARAAVGAVGRSVGPAGILSESAYCPSRRDIVQVGLSPEATHRTPSEPPGGSAASARRHSVPSPPPPPPPPPPGSGSSQLLDRAGGREGGAEV